MTEEKIKLHFEPVDDTSKFNVRLLTFIDGTIVVAQVVDVLDGVLVTVMPFELFAECRASDDTLIGYSFAPYLENLNSFDINRAVRVRFNINHLVTCTIPAEHVIRNYFGQLMYMKRHQDEQDNVKYPETIH